MLSIHDHWVCPKRTFAVAMRCVPMDTNLALLEEVSAGDLLALGERCLREPPSRSLDGEIYCAIHKIRDINPLHNDEMLKAKANGQILVEDDGGEVGWIEVPPFTEELKYAQSLLPEGLSTFYRDASAVCGTALLARHLANEPPPLLSNMFEFCRG